MTADQSPEVRDAAVAYARALTTWRERRNLSKTDLATLMGYSRTRISHVENGTQLPIAEFTDQAERILRAGGELRRLGHALADAQRADRHQREPRQRPDRELRTVEFVAWLAAHSPLPLTQVYERVAALAERLDTEPRSARHARDYARATIGRPDVAGALAAYYRARPAPAGTGLYRARVGGTEVRTSVLTRPSWTGAAVPLGGDREQVTFTPSPPSRPHLSGVTADAAITRLAQVEASDVVLVNNPLYRLVDVDLDPHRLTAEVTLADFAAFALTADLLEAELLDALAARAEPAEGLHLPLRDLHLPSAETALDLPGRTCVGGPLALLAIARPATADRAADYVLLVQERSARVVNAPGRLAVIPKAFHQATIEHASEARLSSTLARELEEELLGRTDLELLADASARRADPLSPRGCTAAMADLNEQRADGGFRIESTAFGINLVTGCFEFPCLIVVDDDSWWARYGHELEANWEADRLRRYSSRDAAGLAQLAHDPAWSNEGLFAYLEGLRRLAERDDAGRVRAPPIETGVDLDA